MTPTHLSMSHEGKETAKDWRCFHCDEVFHDPDSAMKHFGRHELCEPGCLIDLAKYREMEIYMERAAAEDTDKDRAYHAMAATYERRLIEEEEKGYARGLRDGRAYVAAVEKERDRLREELGALKQGIDASAWHYVAGEPMKRILVAETAISRIGAALKGDRDD